MISRYQRIFLVALAHFFLLSGIASAATLTISSAGWSSRSSELRAEGLGASRKLVTISNADTGAALGTISIPDDGRWRFRLVVWPVPCRVKATSEGETAERAVSRAPAGCSGPVSATGSHAGRFSVYEGTKTCLRCHPQQGLDMHASVHYQWKGPSFDVINAPNVPSGKLGSINDFCSYPNINWIGKMVNTAGVTVDGGCARCHAGLGLKPTADATPEQLENIDCLFCHSPQYKRTIESVNGVFRFVPNTAAMSVSLLQAATDITRPSKDACLNCHASSGGGNNFKRGDLEQAHRNPARDFDVHMASKASGGAGLICIDCHQTTNHKISGRGSDLRPRDNAFIPRCTNCHNAAPHGDSRLNRHVQKVDCTVCHIPTFAKVAATDLHRDWSQPADLDPTTFLYEPHMTRQTNVAPVHKFFNGSSYFYTFGDPALPESNGKVLMSAPVGDVADPASRLYAFKRHLGTMAVDPPTRRLLPLKMGILFQTGNIPLAIETGAKDAGWTWNGGYDFVQTERYMGIFHEVAPKEQALSCSTCHDQNRVDFASIGYKPNATRNGKPLCASCHGDKSGEWSGTEYFWRVHQKHVTDKKLDCINCHTFSRR